MGQTGLDYLVKRLKKKSFIVFTIAAVIGTSTVLLLVMGVINLANSIKVNINVMYCT